MSLSSPHLTTGELVTASIWNTDLVDHLNSLPVSSDGLTWQGRINANPQATAPFNASYSAFAFQPLVYKHPIGGVHPSIFGVQFDAPLLGAGTATVTTAATLFINGNPTGATAANIALLVGAGGSSVFQGGVSLATDVNTGISFDDSRVTGVVPATVRGYIGPITGGFFRILANTDSALLLGTNNVDLVRLLKDNLAIDFATADGEYLTIQSTGDVAHGFTADTNPAAFSTLRKASATQGGVALAGYTEGTTGMLFAGNYTTGDATSTQTSNAAFVFVGNKLLVNTAGAMGAADNIAVFRNSTVNRFIFKETGSMMYYTSGGAPAAFDEFDDVALTRAFTLAQPGPGRVASAWDQFVRYHRDDLEAIGLLTADGGVDLMAHTQLLNGAIWQLFLKIQTLTERITQLEATC